MFSSVENCLIEVPRVVVTFMLCHENEKSPSSLLEDKVHPSVIVLIKRTLAVHL